MRSLVGQSIDEIRIRNDYEIQSFYVTEKVEKSKKNRLRWFRPDERRDNSEILENTSKIRLDVNRKKGRPKRELSSY